MKRVWPLAIAASLVLACSASSTPASKSCDAACADGVAVLSVREAMKLLYNIALQGQPVGPQDAMAPCPLGGVARVSGTATSIADQGTTKVDLTYAFAGCAYAEYDSDATKTFSVTIDGSVTEVGTIAVDPSSTTALRIASDSLTVTGTVYTPAIDYAAPSCALMLGQDGDHLSGTFCGRSAGASF